MQVTQAHRSKAFTEQRPYVLRWQPVLPARRYIRELPGHLLLPSLEHLVTEDVLLMGGARLVIIKTVPETVDQAAVHIVIVSESPCR